MNLTAHPTTEYLPALGLCRCLSCGWAAGATNDAHADQVLEEHTAAHEALIVAGVR